MDSDPFERPRILQPRAEALEELGSLRKSDLVRLSRRLRALSRPQRGRWLRPASQLLIGSGLGALIAGSAAWSVIAVGFVAGFALAVAHSAVAQQRIDSVRSVKADLDRLIDTYEEQDG